jgi:hypothetical protein
VAGGAARALVSKSGRMLSQSGIDIGMTDLLMLIPNEN